MATIEQVLNELQKMRKENSDEILRIREAQAQQSANLEAKLQESKQQLETLSAAVTFPIKFKKRGNEEQFRFNSKVDNCFRDIEALAPPDSEPLLEKIAEGRKEIAFRQKLIRIADNSIYGWATVHEYVNDEYADDDDDDKEIERSERKAGRKIKDDRKKNTGRRPSFRSSPPRRDNVRSRSRAAPRVGRCFECGEKGHWKADCSVGSSSKSKISLFIVSSPAVTSPSPWGNLRECIAKWTIVSNNAFVLGIIREGYKLPFKAMPVHTSLRNNLSARDNLDFVREELNSLLSKGCVIKSQAMPFIVNPLTVAINAKGKKRLVLDCRHINKDLFLFRFKYEDAHIARSLFADKDYLFSFDLKSAYHHIRIHPASQPYLGFMVDGEYFTFTVLPFGLSTAGHIFSIVVREMVKSWRNLHGLTIIMYLDDGLGGGSSLEETQASSALVRKELSGFGFVVAEEKSCWTPSKSTIWLGFSWHLDSKKFYVSEQRAIAVKDSVSRLVSQIDKGSRVVKAKILAKLIGKIVSTRLVLGNISLLKVRFLYEALDEALSWSSSVYITDNAISDLHFWQEQFWSLHQAGNHIDVALEGPLFDPSSIKIYCDASASGFGAHIGEHTFSGLWNDSEARQSSTWRELKAISLTLANNAKQIKDSSVRVFSDSLNAVRIADKGSCKTHLHKLANEIHETKAAFDLKLSFSWIPRSLNSKADALSRVVDNDDWGVQHWVFNYLARLSLDCRVQGLASLSLGSDAITLHNQAIKDIPRVLLAAKSASTTKKYFAAFKKWMDFSISVGLHPLPADPFVLITFFSSLIASGSNYSSITAIAYGVKWASDLTGWIDPMTFPMVSTYIEGVKRTCKPPIHRKDPVSPALIQALFTKYRFSKDISVLRDLCMIIIAYAGFLRFSELSSLQCNDISFESDHIVIFIRSSKTDKYRQGDQVVISKGSSCACPLSVLNRYSKAADLDLACSVFLFRPFFKVKGKSCLVRKNKRLSYATAKKCILARLREVDATLNLGLHSLRSGGASAAAAAGAPDRCLLKHGRWSAESSKNLYVHETTQNRLTVSQSLNL